MTKKLSSRLVRECLEEGGFKAKKYTLFGYRKIIASKPVTPAIPSKAYPFPVSYIAYYYTKSNTELTEPTEDEILAIGTFTLKEIESMGVSDFNTIKLGWEMYQTNCNSDPNAAYV